MIPHIQIRKGKQQILLFREGEQLHLVDMDNRLTKEIKEKILQNGCTVPQMQAMGLNGFTIAIRDLEGVAVYDYAAGADLEFHFGKTKQCYKLSQRYEPRQLDAFFKGIPRIQTPRSRIKARGGKGVDWRAGQQNPELLPTMKWISYGLNVVSFLVLIVWITRPEYKTFVNLAAILCGLTAVFLAVFWQEYFTFFDEKMRRKAKIKSKTFCVSLGILPLFFVSLRCYGSYSFFHDGRMLIYAFAIGLMIGFLLTLLTRDLREHFEQAAAAIVFAVIVSLGLVAHTNHIFATEPMEQHQLSVVDQHRSGGKSKSYYLTVVIPEQGELDLQVSRNVYDQCEPGDLIWVSTRTGAWGLDYAILGKGE